MIYICKHCGERVEEAEFMGGKRVIHSSNTGTHCDNAEDSKEAEMLIIDTEKNVVYQKWVSHQDSGVASIDICRNCGTQVGGFVSDLRHLASRSILCDQFDSTTGNAKKLELLTVGSKQEALEYRQFILNGSIPMPLPKGITKPLSKGLIMVNLLDDEEPSYMMFARANVSDNIPTTAMVVAELLKRIDRLEAEKKERGYNGG